MNGTTVPPRTALVHDWFFAPGGAEQVAFELSRLLPGSDVFTSFADRTSEHDLGARLHTWPLQRIFGPTRRYRSFLPLYPLWFDRLNLQRYKLVVSSSSAFAHAARTSKGATHIAYIHTPMRYAWNLDTYLEGSSLSLPSRIAARAIAGPLRRWSRATSARPDVLVANSKVVQQRMRDFWNRDSELIYPPVDVKSIPLSGRDDGFLLIAARMLAYRRIDLAVDACTSLGRELIVVGDGPERARLQARAGRTIRFLGQVDRPTLLDLFSRSHAYVVPGIEDFGIAPVEAMAAGKPVVGFRGGGVAETVVDGETGVLFSHQEPNAVAAAIEALEGLSLSPATIRERAELFDTEVFLGRWRTLLARLGVDPASYSS